MLGFYSPQDGCACPRTPHTVLQHTTCLACAPQHTGRPCERCCATNGKAHRVQRAEQNKRKRRCPAGWCAGAACGAAPCGGLPSLQLKTAWQRRWCSWGARRRWLLHVEDTNPHSLSAHGWLEDTRKVAKYVMSDEDYARRENTYRAYKEQRRKARPRAGFPHDNVCAHTELQRVATSACGPAFPTVGVPWCTLACCLVRRASCASSMAHT